MRNRLDAYRTQSVPKSWRETSTNDKKLAKHMKNLAKYMIKLAKHMIKLAKHMKKNEMKKTRTAACKIFIPDSGRTLDVETARGAFGRDVHMSVALQRGCRHPEHLLFQDPLY
jgi:hypothetical protein